MISKKKINYFDLKNMNFDLSYPDEFKYFIRMNLYIERIFMK